MTQRTFATWVEPLVEANRESRMELVRIARQMPDKLWLHPSPLPNWSNKDLLAHLAGDTNKTFLQILRSVVAREPVDPAVLGPPDGFNERDVANRRERSVDELIAEIEADTKELQALMAQLTEEDRDLRQDGFPMSLGEGLSNEPGGHFRLHTGHLKTAFDSIML